MNLLDNGTGDYSTFSIQQDTEEDRQGQCMHRAMTAFGWFFDLFTVGTSVADVISDLMVAYQFYSDGHALWAWLVWGCFLNSNIVYTAIIVQIGIRETTLYGLDNDKHFFGCLHKLPRPILFLIVFPFAQLSPTLHYVFQIFLIPRMKEPTPLTPDDTFWVDDEACKHATRVELEEAQVIRKSATVVGRLSRAVKNQLRTHGMLFGEALVESVPQTIIQLLAITFLGSPTTLQIISMALSLLSVVSKAYFISVSCHVKVFLCKFCIASHDIMSMFYVFCTLLSAEGTKDVHLFSTSLLVSYLSYAWFIKIAVVLSFFLFISVVFVLLVVPIQILIDGCARPQWRGIQFCFMLFFGYFVLLIPGLLVAETLKLSWLLYFLWLNEQRTEALPAQSLMFSFLSQGDFVQRSAFLHNTSALHENDWKRNYYTPSYFDTYYSTINMTSFIDNNYDEICQTKSRIKDGLEEVKDEHIWSLWNARIEEPPVKPPPPPPRYYTPTTAGTTADAVDLDGLVLLVVEQAQRLESDGLRSIWKRDWSYHEHKNPLGTRQYLISNTDNVRTLIKSACLCSPPRKLSIRYLSMIVNVLRDRELFSLVARIDELQTRVCAEHCESYDEYDFKKRKIRQGELFSTKRLAIANEVASPMIRFSKSKDFIELSVILLNAPMFIILWVGSLFSLVFPFVNVAYQGGAQNGLQWICLCATSLSLFGAIVFLPTLLRYFKFVFGFKNVMSCVHSDYYYWESGYGAAGATKVRNFIRRFHHPTVSQALQYCVPRSAIPQEIVRDVISPMLLQEHLNITALSIKQCEGMRNFNS